MNSTDVPGMYDTASVLRFLQEATYTSGPSFDSENLAYYVLLLYQALDIYRCTGIYEVSQPPLLLYVPLLFLQGVRHIIRTTLKFFSNEFLDCNLYTLHICLVPGYVSFVFLRYNR